MESVKHQNYQTHLRKFSNPHSPRLVSKLLGSVFLFLVMLLWSSLFPFVFQLMQFMSCKMGKNYMFLLCNGILVLIVKNSGLISNFQPQESNQIGGESREKIGGSPLKSHELSQVKKVVMEVKEEPQDMVEEEEEEEEEEEVGLLSAEELNKKCDDFIRKMKEGIKYEAQQVLTH